MTTQSKPTQAVEKRPSNTETAQRRAPYIVRRIAIPHQELSLSQLLVRRGRAYVRRPQTWVAYGAAVLGITLASVVIGVLQSALHVKNLSLLYLLVVLWLAAAFGRAPAIVASVLAFLAYDFFFIPPLYVFTVADPTEWVSLSALLATSLVVGTLTATVQARAREARESQQRTALLYALSQLIVSTTDQELLLKALAARMVQISAPAGIGACALILPNDRGEPVVRAVSSEKGPLTDSLVISTRERAAQATWVLQHGSAAGRALPGTGSEQVALYVPLQSGRRVVGVLGIAGASDIRRLAVGLAVHIAHLSGTPTASGSALPPEDPQTELFVGFCDQIALALDHIALQQEAIHAEALRESDRLKSVLLGSVTHDLRTPLASIQAAAGSLLDRSVSWSEEDRAAITETIETSARRLDRLVSNLLDLSRLEAGVAAPEKRWYPIGDVIATVLDRLDLVGQTRGRQFEVEVAEDVPLVPMDHAQMEQVLTNLIENALKYSPKESVIRLQARVITPPAMLEVRVVDQGVGIPPDELEAVFDKFYRVQHVDLPWAAGRPPVGTGLGLAICAGIVRAHGGHIWAESKLGKGSTFIFTLPIPDSVPPGKLSVPRTETGQDQSPAPPAAAAVQA